MSKLLNDFWEWAQTSPDEFAKNGGKLKNGQEDFLFPKYDQLIGDAQNQIQTKKTSDSTITFFLMVMAIDNEEETLLDFAASDLSDETILQLCLKGVRFQQPHARWQIAELIKRRQPQNWKSLLSVLQNDENEYVRKRAKNNDSRDQ